MKARAPGLASLQLTPTILPCPAELSEKRSSAGASLAHGPHQLAQNTTSAGRPPAPANRLESVTGRPTRRSRGSAGARRPVEELEAKPNTVSTAATAATTTIKARTRSRRVIGGTLS